MEVARGGLATLDRPRDADPSVSRLPPRILAAIGSRLDQLSEEATEALEIAATIGRAFTFDVLEQASELEEAAPRPGARRAVAAADRPRAGSQQLRLRP